MLYIDANIIIRIMVCDNLVLAEEAREIVSKNDCFVRNEVFAEVVYVLNGVYKIPREDIGGMLTRFLDSVKTENEQVLEKAFGTYSATKLDFVDCLLAAYHSVCGIDVRTFDKKLINFMNRTTEH